MRHTSFWIVRGLPVADAVVLAGALAIVVPWSMVAMSPAMAFVVVLALPVTQHFLFRFGVYDSHRLEEKVEVVRKVGMAHLAAAVIVVSASALFGAGELTRKLLEALASSFAFLALSKTAVYTILQWLRRGGFDRRRVLYLGRIEQADRFAAVLAGRPEWGLEIGCMAPAGPATDREYVTYPGGERISHTFEDVLRNEVVDEVLISADAVSLPGAFEEARRFEQYGLLVRVLVEPLANGASARLEPFVGAASLAVAQSPRTERDLAMKRLLDVAFASITLFASAPLMLLIAILVKLTSPGPVLYSQIRAGMNGRRFRMYKFRTMVDQAEFLVRQANRSITQGPIFKDPQDYRITAIGRVLRKFSLDELPQMWNVLRGDMSVVGPRPLPIYEADRIDGEYRRRFSVPPGLTCIWQVSGRSDTTYDTWMRQDLEYVDRWSLWDDTKLILKTIPVVFTGRGGY